MDYKQLKILQHNIQSIRSSDKREELQYFLNSEEVDIAALQEIWLKEGEGFRIKGFNFVSKRRTEGYGGVGLLIREHIQYEKIKIRNMLPIEVVGITTKNLKINMSIISIYIPPEAESVAMMLQKINDFFQEMGRLKGDIVVCGDFNAHSQRWDKQRPTCTKGQAIEDGIDHSRLVLLNNGAMTTMPRIDCRPSAIDLTMATN